MRSDSDVLERLNEGTPTGFIWQLTILATIGGFLFGYDTANIGAALPFVPYNLTGFALGYLVAGASVGAAAGAFCAGPLTDRFGRKSLLVADAGLYAVGALLSAFTWNAEVLLAARTLIGLAIGADSAIATAYISEYAPRNRRGSLGMLQQWMITVGILLSYAVAIGVLLLWPHSATGADWRVILGLGAVPALIGLVMRVRMPESPRWLLRQGKYDRVRDALRMLNVDASTEEIRATAERLDEDDKKLDRQRSRLWGPGVRRALLVVCGFFVFQQITGINVPFYYGPKLLASYFQSGGGKVASSVAGVEVTAIMAAVNVIATYFGFRWIDRRGRRPLAIGGYLGMAVFMLVGAIGVGYLTGMPKIILVMVGFNLFIASFAIGVGGTGWLIQGEVFPTEVRGRAAAIGATVDWLANFALIEVFPVWQKSIGLGWVMVCFAVLSVIAVGFVVAFLPETKQMPVEDIIRAFTRTPAPGLQEVASGSGARAR